jgi:hypothetical protein
MSLAFACAANESAAGSAAGVSQPVAVSREGGWNVMLPKILKYGAVLSCGVLVILASLLAAADDKKGDKPALSGTWGKKDGELRIEFVDKGVLKIAPHGDSAVLAVVCNYTVAKERRVKVKIAGFEGREEAKKKVAERVPVGLKFSFAWTVKGHTARLDDLTGDNVELLKSHLEGDFERKK